MKSTGNEVAIMKDLRLHEGELNVMELLWSNKALAAKDISKIIKEYIGWEKNTTYTVFQFHYLFRQCFFLFLCIVPRSDF